MTLRNDIQMNASPEPAWSGMGLASPCAGLTAGSHGTFSAASLAGHSGRSCVLTSNFYPLTFNLISSQWVSIVCDDTLGEPTRGNSHPYAAEQDTKYTYSLGNSLVSQVTFSDSTCVGDGDTLKVYDGSGKLVGVYTGDELQGKTLEIVGSTVTVELISDGGENDSYGFSISSITGVPFSILPLMWEATKKATKE
ncbi:MAG TPA: hypothetical protein VLM37_10270 [Fibrobacteraceae bacterium]|nr:hypothetical protein [Fibrobacteraceae bacterium]